tara:strand:- start:2900 stop:3820 length:921 start_codon:yes stop_codon:yes gene_type:complete
LKILILVINSNQYPSNTIVPFLKRTWGKDDRVDVIYYQGGSTEIKFNGKVLKLDVPSSDEFMNQKGLKAFEWILDNIEFDVVYRCTTTAYLNIDNLINFVKNKSLVNFFCGKSNYYPHDKSLGDERIGFISGAGCFFSKDVVKKLIENKNKYDFSLNDDVAIGKLLHKELGIPIHPGTYQDFLYGYPTLKDINFDYFHYRFKLGNTSLKLHYPRFLEVLILISLHVKTQSKKNSKNILKLLSAFFDFFFPIIFEIFRILNPNYYLAILKKALPRLNKLIVFLIKSNKISRKFFRYIKNLTNFKGFK